MTLRADGTTVEALAGVAAGGKYRSTGAHIRAPYNPRMTSQLFTRHFSEHQEVIASCLKSLQSSADAASEAIITGLAAGGKVLAFGNGGSATQANHLVEELIGRFKETRRPLPAISLAGDAGVITCIANDFGYEALFERQVEGLAARGDVVVGITTSGRSPNVLRGFKAAKARGATTIALCGKHGLRGEEADHVVSVPSEVGAYIQEVHLMLLHVWCIAVDAAIASGKL
jgi:D-sedoheptulose 7-phosphate isomerase